MIRLASEVPVRFETGPLSKSLVPSSRVSKSPLPSTERGPRGRGPAADPSAPAASPLRRMRAAHAWPFLSGRIAPSPVLTAASSAATHISNPPDPGVS